MKTKYLILSIMSTLFLSYFSAASAITFTNNYSKSADIEITSVANGKDCGYWDTDYLPHSYERYYNTIYYFKLYAKPANAPTPSITINRDEQPDMSGITGLCIYQKHAGEDRYNEPKAKIAFGSVSKECEIFVNGEDQVKVGPGCTKLSGN